MPQGVEVRVLSRAPNSAIIKHMQLDLTTPALLFPGVAILMLGYINRYLGTATVIRNFRKDYDAGYKHVDLARQLTILRRRIGLSRLMMATAAVALLLACLSMLLVFEEAQNAGEVVFSLALLAMILSICLALYETALSNKSLLIEINDILNKEKTKD